VYAVKKNYSGEQYFGLNNCSRVIIRYVNEVYIQVFYFEEEKDKNNEERSTQYRYK